MNVKLNLADGVVIISTGQRGCVYESDNENAIVILLGSEEKHTFPLSYLKKYSVVNYNGHKYNVVKVHNELIYINKGDDFNGKWELTKETQIIF